MNTKTIILVVVTLGIIGLILWFMGQEKKQTGLMLQIIDNKTGKVLEAHSPVDLTENSSYTIRATIKNTSTKLGQTVPAHLITVLTLWYKTAAGVSWVIKTKADDHPFAAGETYTTDLIVTIPSVAAGLSGTAVAVVSVADLNLQVADKTIETRYVAAPTTWGAELGWGVI